MINLKKILYVIFLLASTTALTAQNLTARCSGNEARNLVLQPKANGYFSNLIFAASPYYVGDLNFQNREREALTLQAFQGKIIVVNMWAMWCAPCRAEMADLAQLDVLAGGDDGLEIIAINMDKTSIDNDKIDEFLREVKADNLTLYRDENMETFKKLRRSIPARGLPLTLIVDNKGCLIAHLAGAAPWGNEDSVNFIETIKKAKDF